MFRSQKSTVRVRSGFTLLELLCVIVVLGLAGAMIIPAMGETGILRVQGAVRMVVSDITFIQSDAVAFQERRAMVFDVANNRYTLVAVPGNVIDVQNNVLYDPTKRSGRYEVNLSDARFGDSRMTQAGFDGDNVLMFDALGGPVVDAGSNAASAGGTVTIIGMQQTFRIQVDAFTGRVRVVRSQGEDPAGSGGDSGDPIVTDVTGG
ncbi:MAG: prepilin-type N-terminal cleavage/methylation domain-containing protein [Phycisphaeraceae bacterium]|nr:prepilin-type N-terminal cleavage/methylation domain-containing protein [Phycisphaeraceae bacterium]